LKSRRLYSVCAVISGKNMSVRSWFDLIYDDCEDQVFYQVYSKDFYLILFKTIDTKSSSAISKANKIFKSAMVANNVVQHLKKYNAKELWGG